MAAILFCFLKAPIVTVIKNALIVTEYQIILNYEMNLTKKLSKSTNKMNLINRF